MLGIILRLGMPHLVIFSGFICKEFLVGSGLDDSALVEHQDSVAESAGGQAVATLILPLR